MSLVIFFNLKSSLILIEQLLLFSLLMFAWCIIFHFFSAFQYCYIWSEFPIDKMVLDCEFFWITSVNLWLSTGVLRPLTFKVIIEMLGLKPAILFLFSFSFLYVSYFCFPFLTFLWATCTLFRIPSCFVCSGFELIVGHIFLEVALGILIPVHNLESTSIKVLLLWVKYIVRDLPSQWPPVHPPFRVSYLVASGGRYIHHLSWEIAWVMVSFLCEITESQRKWHPFLKH